MIRLVLVEDHTIVRQGLKLLLSQSAEFKVQGEAGTGIEGMTVIARIKPDVALVDLTLPDMSGIEVIHEVRRVSPETRVVVLSMHSSPQYVQPALRAGACGYLVKGADVEALADALRTVMSGEQYLSPTVRRCAETHAPAGAETLSARELEVLRLVAQGKTSAEIAVILSLAPKTVENHRQRIMDKLDVHDTASLTRFAVKAGIVTPD
jgi:DNA-binding NarL/FixJ family response regulator